MNGNLIVAPFTFGSTAQPAATSSSFTFGQAQPATFNFGGTAAPSTGFSIGTTAPSTGSSNTNANTTSGFSFGTAAPAAPSTGFSIGSTAPSTGFSISSTAPSTGFSIGSTTPSTGFTLGNTPAAPTATSTGFSIGSTSAAPSTGISLAAAPSTGGFSFNTTTGNAGTAAPASSTALGSAPVNATSSATSAPSFSFGNATTAEAVKPFSFVSTKPSETKPVEANTFSFIAKPAESTKPADSSVTFKLPDSSKPDGFSVVKPGETVASVATPMKPSDLSQSVLSTPAQNPTTPGPLTLSALKPAATASSSTTISAVPVPSNIRSKTLEDIINDWSGELEQQVKEFHKQAAKVNEWDMKLIENGDKISKLLEESIKNEARQKEIEQNLSFVESQQKELGAVLDQLNSQVDKISLPMKQSNVIVDQEREKVYESAEKLTKELNEISGDLKGLVNQMNHTKNEANESDISIICEILNSHLNSLQWAEKSINELGMHLTELEKSSVLISSDQHRLFK